MSSFCRLFAASRISPSAEMNSVNIKSAPWALHKARKGGSLTSSIGANSRGKSPKSILPIFAIAFFEGCKSTKSFVGLFCTPGVSDGATNARRTEIPRLKSQRCEALRQFRTIPSIDHAPADQFFHRDRFHFRRSRSGVLAVGSAHDGNLLGDAEFRQPPSHTHQSFDVAVSALGVVCGSRDALRTTELARMDEVPAV